MKNKINPEEMKKIHDECPYINYDEKIVNLETVSPKRPNKKFVHYMPHNATWDHVTCPHANKENSSCNLATQMANRDVKIQPSDCVTCAFKNQDLQTIPHARSLGVEALINEKMLNINKSDAYQLFRDMLGPGPGTELHKIIPKFLESEGCSCRDMAKKMNTWGPDTCEKHREYIVDYLIRKGKDVKLFGWVPRSAMREVADRMLTMAITRARKNETEEWFVAVTTAPRKEPTVEMCLESLTLAGFRPYIFAEPKTNGLDMDTHGERLVLHNERMGVWQNWIYSARYAIENSSADIIMTVQDDSLFHPDCKIFTESILWPAKDVGFVSLYTPKHYSFRPKDQHELRAPGVNRIHTRSLWGACALVWPRKVLEEVLQDDIIYNWLGAPTRTKSIWEKKKEERRNDSTQIQNSDTAIGKIMNKMKRSMYFVDPSPVNHFATHSTTGHGGNRGRRNCHRCAKFSAPLQRQVPLMNNEQELFKIDYKDIEI